MAHAGSHVVKLVFSGTRQNIDFVDFGTSATPTNTVVPITTVTVAPTVTTSGDAYKPHNLPARIEAEDYDNGGANTAYFDSTAGNLGKAYRLDQDVDVEAGATGYNVGYSVDSTPAGSVQVPNTGSSSVFVDVPMNLNLPAGTHVLKLAFVGNKQNIDYIDFPSGPHAQMALTSAPTGVEVTSTAAAVANNTTTSE